MAHAVFRAAPVQNQFGNGDRGRANEYKRFDGLRDSASAAQESATCGTREFTGLLTDDAGPPRSAAQPDGVERFRPLRSR